MIRISQQNSAKEAKRYYTTADYYSQGQETVGRWGGRGAERLGLSGLVDKVAFEQLCDNLDPNSGEPLTVRTKRDRTVGYDFTFSVPKSISLVYGLTGDESLLQAFRESVDETMKEIESEMQTRVRRSGCDENRPTGNLIWAEFIHSTSRPVDGLPDPHLLSIFLSSIRHMTVRKIAGKPASSARSSGTPRIFRRPFGCGWPTSSRISGLA